MRIIIISIIMLLFIPLCSGMEFQNPPDAVMELNPSTEILEGVLVEFSANDSDDLFDYEYFVIRWWINGIMVSTERSFVRSFDEGDYDVTLYVKTHHGNDSVFRHIYVDTNDVPDIEGQVIYFDPYDKSEKKSERQISIPLYASVLLEVWNEDESDDDLSFSIDISPCCGLEVADIEDDDDEITVSLFASESGKYDVLITGTDEAGQKSDAKFSIHVGSPKELLLDYPDSIDEGKSVGFSIQHPCSDEICDYSIVIYNIETGERREYSNNRRISFSDSGPMDITGSIIYNGSLLDTVTKSFYVEDTKNDPPVITIEWDEPVYAQIPHKFHVTAWDDRDTRVKEILVEIHGDYEDDERVLFTKIPGSEGNFSLTPRRADSYEIVVKCHDSEGESTEITARFDTLPPDEAPESEENGEEEEEAEEPDWEEGTRKTPFLSGVTALLILLFSAGIYKVKVR